jgi:CheY-like chemotaxis protein
MPSLVLSVGQCRPDQQSIQSIIEQHFDANVETADSIGEGLNLLRSGRYDLVLVNRIIFNDGQEGLDLIRIAKREELSTPVMLVSDYPDSQSQAVAAGGVPGFGKVDLHGSQALEHLMKFLPVRYVVVRE